MKRICLFVIVSALAGLGPVAFAKTHRDTYPVSCNVLWPAVKDAVRNSGQYGIIAIDNAEMAISYNIGGGLGGKRINSAVLNRLGENSCEMQTQTAFSGLVHNDAGDFKKRVEESLARLPKTTEKTAKELPQPGREASAGNEQSAATGAARQEQGVVNLTSNAEAVEVSIDGALVGTTPARMKLAAGKHRIRAVLNGYDDWEREVEVLPGSEANLRIVLKKRE